MVDQVFEALRKEYHIRRKMLVERAKVTLQSMLWSKEYLETKGTLERAQTAAQKGQEELLEDPELQLQDIFNARIGGSRLTGETKIVSTKPLFGAFYCVSKMHAEKPL